MTRDKFNKLVKNAGRFHHFSGIPMMVSISEYAQPTSTAELAKEYIGMIDFNLVPGEDPLNSLIKAAKEKIYPPRPGEAYWIFLSGRASKKMKKANWVYKDRVMAHVVLVKFR